MKKVLFVCGGNTCRSPMAEAILKQMLRERGLESEIAVDSAAKGRPTSPSARDEAREAIRLLYRKDLLVNHKSKAMTDVRLDDFHLILTMESRHKHGLPANKTYTLKEYAGQKGDIQDPYNRSIEVYQICRDEIGDCLRQVLEKIIEDC